MSTFKITQSVKSANLFLIPSADGCNIDLTPFGEVNNWKCVDDPKNSSDDDATYNYNNTANLKHDLYGLPNHTTETGTINYVQVFARAKSHIFAQHSEGIYKILITDNACGDIYKSDDKDLTTSYGMHNKVWVDNPRTASAFTWDDIDNLQVGVECDSPEITGAGEILTIRPIAAGDVTQLISSGDTPNWKCVDDVTKDDGATVVKMFYNVYPGYDETLYDLYNLTNHTTEIGSISKVVVFAWVFAQDSYGGKAVTVMKIGGNTYYGTNPVQNERTWKLISTEYVENPATSSSWTWDNIDDLQAGIKLNEPFEVAGYTLCTQVYVAIHHVEDVSPEIRTTQEYVKVNYSPPDAECTMDKPETIGVGYDQKIKMFNFWSGTRAVYGLSRNNKPMVMRGTIYSDTACDTIQCVQTMADEGEDVTISGLGGALWNGVYKIRSFGWKHISECPEVYDWILELEDVRYCSECGDGTYD